MSNMRFPPPINPEGWRFIPIFAIVALLLFWLWQPLGWLGVMATLFCAAFFRDPDRVTLLADRRAIVSPADGLIIAIAPAPPPPELDMGVEPLVRISVFMSVFDVHVNRVPAAGLIERLAYVPGRFVNASLDKASEFNERMAIRMRLEAGEQLAFVQIAGLVARRIRCDLHEGETVEAGQRFGLIRFGSRADVYLPEGFSATVAVGQKAVAGESVLALPAAPPRPAAAKRPRRTKIPAA
jgi:phosphatidylserine decarboxylase